MGGGLAYGPDNVGGSGGIAKSVAIKFDLYSNSGEGVDSTGLYVNGAAPTNVGSIDLTPSGVDLHSGDPMLVNMGYDGTTLTVNITDTITSKSETQTYTIDIPGTVGSSSAYVGFTGGTGGAVATQDILTWFFSPNANLAPGGPTGLGATPGSATSIGPPTAGSRRISSPRRSPRRPVRLPIPPRAWPRAAPSITGSAPLTRRGTRPARIWPPLPFRWPLRSRAMPR
jgi:hypothetical protein